MPQLFSVTIVSIMDLIFYAKANNIWYYFNQSKQVPFLLNTNFLNFNLESLANEILFNINNQPIFILFGIFFFLSSLVSLIFFSYLGLYGTFFVLFFPITLFWLSSLFYINAIFVQNCFFYVNFGKWINFSSNLSINFDFMFDNVSFSFLFLTLSIALCVIFFSFSYFRYEPLVERLMVFLSFFIISMIFLVSTNNFVNFFLGWELIGLTSFILINFWSTKISTLKSSFKAFSFNKFSDASLLIGIVSVFNLSLNMDISVFNFQELNIKNVFVDIFFFKVNLVDFIGTCLFFSASIKSAQIGAHIWLPDSMEAPVPASALIHSATLVSAGIFIILRFSNLFENSYFLLLLISCIGSITAFYGGFTAMNQTDTKKILAYSTISHCGFLMVLTTSGLFEFVLIYLYVHGFFKAAIFMGVGGVNRLNKNYQDIRKMGTFYKLLPFECFMIIVGLFNLAGLPFSLGFYIKHVVLLSLKTHILFSLFILSNCLFAALTGLYYSFRLIFYVFFDFKKNKINLFLNYNSLNLKSRFKSNSNIGSILPITILFLLSLIFGIYFLNIYLSKNKLFSESYSLTDYSSIFFYFLSKSSLDLFFSYINWFIIINFIWLSFTQFRAIFQKTNNFILVFPLFLLISFLS